MDRADAFAVDRQERAAARGNFLAGRWQDLSPAEQRLLNCLRLRAVAGAAEPTDRATQAALALAGLVGRVALLDVLLQVLRRHAIHPFRLAPPMASFLSVDERHLLDAVALAQDCEVTGPGPLWGALDAQGCRLAPRILAHLAQTLNLAGLCLPQPGLPDIDATRMPPLVEDRAAQGAFHIIR